MGWWWPTPPGVGSASASDTGWPHCRVGPRVGHSGCIRPIQAVSGQTFTGGIMSVQMPRQEYVAQQATAYPEDYERGYGWIVFAATMLGILAVMNVIEGIAAISRSHFFVGN